MLEKLFGPQASNLQRALSRTSERHSLLSENLANLNVAGYKRKDIDFGIELETAESNMASQLLNSNLSRDDKPTISEGSIRADGNSVDLEQEVAGIGEAELRYQMLSEMTSRYFSGLKAAIREGK